MNTNATIEQLEKALAKTNEKYAGNLKFRKIEQTGKRVRFTLTVINSRGAGARLGMPDYNTGKQRHISAACWHAHGEFFDNLFDIAPAAYVRAGDKKITIDGGNWEDRNIGSMYSPMYYSDACEC